MSTDENNPQDEAQSDEDKTKQREEFLNASQLALKSIERAREQMLEPLLRRFEQLAREASQQVLGPIAHIQEVLRRATLPELVLPHWDLISEGFQRIQERWIESLPDNWRDLTPTELEDVRSMMETTGWGLVWVPRTEVLRELLDASDDATAGRRLLANQAIVITDLRSCLDEVTAPELGDLRAALEQAVTAFKAGARLPSQAMVATVLTSIIQRELQEPNLTEVGRRWRAINPEEEPFLAFRRSCLLRAVASSLDTYWPSHGDPVPSRFNRHATAHHLDLTQFNDENALSGLLLGVGFLRELQAAVAEESAEGAEPAD